MAFLLVRRATFLQYRRSSIGGVVRGNVCSICLGFVFAVLGLLQPVRAQTPEKILVSPIPAWVVIATAPVPRTTEGAVDFRLVDIQTRVDADGLHQYFHQIARPLKPEGLIALGNFGIGWQPPISVARVHKVTIRRDGAVIDVLGNGSGFQVLRREANLEKLQLDGSLTAVIQISDLRVGDEIETAWTLDTQNPVLGGRTEQRQFFAPGPDFGRLFLRYSWPRARDVHHVIGGALPKSVALQSAVDNGFIIDKANYDAPPLPDGAPSRFLLNNAIEMSDFADWKSVAVTMQPLYDEAARIPPDSPVQIEIRRIAALSADPVVRAIEALRTVQGQVRYFARFDGLGAYKPETADAVWAGRVGDCKGKTVLLLALLRGLGIEADAALVSSGNGDGLDKALPMPSRFDHVIVRTVIGGKTHWLDGTRLGDRSLDTIVVPPFKWALPISARSAALVPLVAVDPVVPQQEWRLDLDARAGIDKPAKATGIAVFRGEKASDWRAALAVMATTSRDTFLRNTWTSRYDRVKIDSVSYRYDDANGEIRLSMAGTGEMDWNNKGETRYNNYESNYATLGQNLTTKRIEALQAVAPIYVASRFESTLQTILLPDGGRGFRLDGGNIDSEIGGVHYHRDVKLVGERFDMSTTTRSSEGELSYADAVAADKATDELVKKRLFIDLPVTAALAVAVSKPKAVGAPVRLKGKAARAELISGSISDSDYPPEAIRDNVSGVTTVSFDIGADGRVGECGIANTSGSVPLDDKSCALIRERFVFKPARGPDGSATSETRNQRIAWRLPEGPQQIEPYDVTFSLTLGPDGIGRDCKTMGVPTPPPQSAEQCAKAGGGVAMTDKDGKAITVILTEHHVRTITPVVPQVKPPAPNSGNPR
jgi:TonB family protein